MRPIKRFGIAAASNCWMAFQNEPRFMAACRLSKVFSSDGSITASRFMPSLEVRFICLPPRRILAQPRFFAVALGRAHSRNAQQSRNQKRQPKLPGDHPALRECVTYANETTNKCDNPTS